MDTLKIGRYIQHLRKSANMTQKDLAEKLNISFQAVSKWEGAQYLKRLKEESCFEYPVTERLETAQGTFYDS